MLLIKAIFTIANTYISVYSVKLSYFHTYLFNSSRVRGPLYEVWRATFGPRATGWETLVYTYVGWLPLSAWKESRRHISVQQ